VYCESAPALAIAKGVLTVEALDEELALTFAFPKAQLHLTRQVVKGTDWRHVDLTRLEARSADGAAFSGLLAGQRYYAVVIEDGAEKEKYEAAQRERAAAFAVRAARREEDLTVDFQLSLESCSCIEGNPCATPECCQDFSGRFENARRVMEDRRARRAEGAAAAGGGGGGGGGGSVSTAERERLQREAMSKLGSHSYKKL
jgi:hypothetical protein